METAALPALMAVERLEEFRAATTDTGMEKRIHDQKYKCKSWICRKKSQ